MILMVSLPREERRVDDVDVLRSVNLSVQIHNGCSASKAAVGSDLGGSDPVVGATGSWCLGKAGNVCLNRHVG